MGIFLIVLLTLGLFVLPLLPGLNEWMRARDDQPLRVVQEYDGNIRHFANGFRHYLETRLGDVLAREPALQAQDGQLPDGTQYQIAGARDGVRLTGNEESSKTLRRVVLSLDHLSLPDQILYEGEIYSKGDINTGFDNYFRALLADGCIRLKSGSKVLRWMHGDAIEVSGDCELYGRVSAEEYVMLNENCRFERLNAPRLQFGDAAPVQPVPSRQLTVIGGLEDIGKVIDQSGSRWLMEGDLTLPSNTLFSGNIVTRGHLALGEGVHLQGSAKSNKDMALEGGSVIEGSLVSAGSLFIGPNCRVHGPVIAEKRIVIYAGAVIGAPDRLTTISAPEIFIDPGVVTHGTVWASAMGMVKRLPEEATV